MPGFSAHVATTSFASVSIEIACTSMYGAITRESPRAVMIDAFMSCTSLAMSEPDTRSRVFAASSLMLQRRCRRISNVIGSVRIAGPVFAFVDSAIVIVSPTALLPHSTPSRLSARRYSTAAASVPRRERSSGKSSGRCASTMTRSCSVTAVLRSAQTSSGWSSPKLRESPK